MKIKNILVLSAVCASVTAAACAEIEEIPINDEPIISMTVIDSVTETKHNDTDTVITEISDSGSTEFTSSELPSASETSFHVTNITPLFEDAGKATYLEETTVILSDENMIFSDTSPSADNIASPSDIYGVNAVSSVNSINVLTPVVIDNINYEDTQKPRKKPVTENTGPQILSWDENWKYADHSAICKDTVTLYRSAAAERKNKVIAINAGHGTIGGSSVKTYCHPDHTPKYVTGSTAAGAVKSTAISAGMEFPDGTPEGDVTLAVALKTKEQLLAAGYDVLMMRETKDCQLDNIARTVFANQYADCHISLHFDSSTNNKGAFYIGVPDIKAYKSMEPVASYWKEHTALGDAVINGMRKEEIKVYGSGRMDIDLTQTSFSTIPSIDLELGDKGTSVTDSFKEKAANAIVRGVDEYFGK